MIVADLLASVSVDVERNNAIVVPPATPILAVPTDVVTNIPSTIAAKRWIIESRFGEMLKMIASLFR